MHCYLATCRQQGAFVNYACGNNLPGCLPDMPVPVFATFDEAKRCLIADLKRAEDSDIFTEDEAEELAAAAEDVNLWSELEGPQAITVCEQVWWIDTTTEEVSE